jgi:Fe-S-cluster containining protein
LEAGDMKYGHELSLSDNELTDVKKVFRKWKRRKPKDLDNLFHEAHDEVFQEIDCLKCANCCKTTSPIFRDVDIKRISRRLKMTVTAFEDTYLKEDEEGDKVLLSSPCAFLGVDNKCNIYEDRPLACREYPHTDRKRMYQILDLTIKNTKICPAVSEIVRRAVK